MTDQLLQGNAHIHKLIRISKCVRQQKKDKRQKTKQSKYDISVKRNTKPIL